MELENKGVLGRFSYWWSIGPRSSLRKTPDTIWGQSRHRGPE